MDKNLQKTYDRLLEIYPMLPEGEKVMQDVGLALQFGVREKIVYRFAQNGSIYNIRWTEHHIPFNIPASIVPLTIVNRAIKLAGENKGDYLVVDEYKEIDLFPADTDDTPDIGVLREMAQPSPKIVDGIIEVDPIDATESAIKLSDENEVDLQDVAGTGKEGRITLSDVRSYIDGLSE